MYRAEVCSPTDLLALAAELEAAGPQSAFASPHWLGPLMETLAPDAGAEALGVVASRTDGTVAGALPLAVTRERGVCTVRFADFGVTDYAAPLVGPAAPADAESMAAFRAAIISALAPHDLIRFERLLPMVGGHLNPLAADPSAVASRMRGHVITVPESVKAYVAGLGRKMRKEVERCQRNIEAAGPLRVVRARAGVEAAAAFDRLAALQSTRWADAEPDRYRLDRPAYARFYRDVLERGAGPGYAHVLTLVAGEVPVGAVFGLRAADRFVVLRIGSDDAEWGRFSPGRITLIAAMEHLVAEGIRTFDLGVGDYAFKRRLGAGPVALTDLTLPLSWAGVPVAAGLRAKVALARRPALRRLAARLRGRGED